MHVGWAKCGWLWCTSFDTCRSPKFQKIQLWAEDNNYRRLNDLNENKKTCFWRNSQKCIIWMSQVYIIIYLCWQRWSLAYFLGVSYILNRCFMFFRLWEMVILSVSEPTKPLLGVLLSILLLLSAAWVLQTPIATVGHHPWRTTTTFSGRPLKTIKPATKKPTSLRFSYSIRCH